MDKQKRGLGRGLSALMADVGVDEGPQTTSVRATDEMVPIEKISPNPDQPRRRFTDDDLEDLAASIKAKGILQPLIVRQDPSGLYDYQIVAGERRWRAAQLVQQHQVPVIVKELTDTEVLEIAIIENIQRADLNPIEEAAGYRQLMDRFGHTQERLAEALGKSRSHIANLLRLLGLPSDVQKLVTEGQLTAGHARALITSDKASELARSVVAKGLSVRETEKLAKGTPEPDGASSKETPARQKMPKDADTVALERDLAANLNMGVRIDHQPNKENGSVTISYASLEQLDELCRILSLN